MITNVKLYECAGAVDYYALDENGQASGDSNLVYTGNSHYLVEWCDEREGVSAIQERQFPALIDALAFYKEMKERDNE